MLPLLDGMEDLEGVPRPVPVLVVLLLHLFIFFFFASSLPLLHLFQGFSSLYLPV